MGDNIFVTYRVATRDRDIKAPPDCIVLGLLVVLVSSETDINNKSCANLYY